MQYKLVRRPHLTNFVDWAGERPEVLALSADLTNSCELGLFRDKYPERFLSFGMAEQNMLGFAGGLAREGFRPFVHTFAVFLYRRAYDQLAMSIAYPNLPVRLVGFLPGLTTPGGVTHQAIEDVSILRATPNMTILEPGDATEVESVLSVADEVDGPVYIRMLRGDIPRLFPTSEPLRHGEGRMLSDGQDITLFTTGIATQDALPAVAALAERGVGIRHMHVSTLKPFASPQVVDAIRHARKAVVTMENHTVVGGLGSAVSELMAESGCDIPLVRLGLDDRYAHGASLGALKREYGIDGRGLVSCVERITGTVLAIADDELRLQLGVAGAGAAKAEAL